MKTCPTLLLSSLLSAFPQPRRKRTKAPSPFSTERRLKVGRERRNSFEWKTELSSRAFLDKKVPNNEFLVSKKEYADFELRFEAKLIGPGNNAGVQFRSQRIPKHHEMIGYQCDIGGWSKGTIWGFFVRRVAKKKNARSSPSGKSQLLGQSEGGMEQIESLDKGSRDKNLAEWQTNG